MAKIKFTKGELKRQRDSLKQFLHFLPVLQLKKQQLQLEIQKIRTTLSLKIKDIDNIEDEVSGWAGFLNEDSDIVSEWVKKGTVVTGVFNIAGIDVPVFERVDFEEAEYDLFLTPLWIDRAIDRIRGFVALLEEKKIIDKQLEILETELRITAQRVNLFEKIKIPECRENIRLTRIYLGDQQTNAVGRSKIAKAKIAKLALEEVFV